MADFTFISILFGQLSLHTIIHMLCAFFNVNSAALTPPKNRAVLNGSRVTFIIDYGFPLDKSFVSWFNAEDDLVGQGSGYTHLQAAEGYNYTQYDTISALTVEPVSGGETFNIKQIGQPNYYAELIALDSEPICNSDPRDVSSVYESSVIVFRCSVTTSGKYTPTVEWSHDGNVLQGSTFKVIKDPTFNKTVSEYQTNITSARNTAFTATIYFKVPMVPADTGSKVYARNAPDYSFEWTSGIIQVISVNHPSTAPTTTLSSIAPNTTIAPDPTKAPKPRWSPGAGFWMGVSLISVLILAFAARVLQVIYIKWVAWITSAALPDIERQGETSSVEGLEDHTLQQENKIKKKTFKKKLSKKPTIKSMKKPSKKSLQSRRSRRTIRSHVSRRTQRSLPNQSKKTNRSASNRRSTSKKSRISKP